MSMAAGPKGACVISWSQTEIDGQLGGPVEIIANGAMWTWQGAPVQIDRDIAGDAARRFDRTSTPPSQRAILRARHLVSRALIHEGVQMSGFDDMVRTDRAFVVSDGHHRWAASLIETPALARPLIVFAEGVPPRGMPLLVVEGPTERPPHQAHTGQQEGVVCFAPGTWLETPKGPRLVETLVAGDLVITEVMQNPAAVSDSVGEWFELYNASTAPIDLRGMAVADLGGEIGRLGRAVGVPTPLHDAGTLIVQLAEGRAGSG